MTDGIRCAAATKEVRVKDLVENAKLCACPSCPTFGECMNNRGDRLYCARGATECPVRRLGCVCGECGVAIANGLSSNYYCDNGVAKF
jgi:hypothetical protein